MTCLGADERSGKTEVFFVVSMICRRDTFRDYISQIDSRLSNSRGLKCNIVIPIIFTSPYKVESEKDMINKSRKFGNIC